MLSRRAFSPCVAIFLLLPFSVKSEEGEKQVNLILCGTEDTGSFLETAPLPIFYYRSTSGSLSFIAEEANMNRSELPTKGDLSFEWQTDYLYLSAGRRFFPGAKTSLWRDNQRLSGFSDIPDGKTRQSAFFSLSFIRHLPGIFVNASRERGLFLADPQRRYLALWLPESNSGALSVYLKKSSHSLILDLLRSERDTQGFLSSTYDSGNGSLLRFDAERRTEWDEAESGLHRRGKSGLISALYERDFEDRAFLTGEVAGIDRGDGARRMVGIDGGIGKISDIHPVFRARLYAHRQYGSSRGLRTERAGGVGLAIRKRNFRFSVLGEMRESGTSGAEIQSAARFGSTDFSLSAIRNFNIHNGSSFSFIRLNPHYGSGILFQPVDSPLYALKIKSKSLYFLFQMGETEGRPEHFSALQLRITF
jgi:hypothetical protein